MYRLFEKKSSIAYLISIIVAICLANSILSKHYLYPLGSETFLLRFLDSLSPKINQIIILALISLSSIGCILLYRFFNQSTKSFLIPVFVFLVNSCIAIHFRYNVADLLLVIYFLLTFQILIKTNRTNSTSQYFYNLGFLFSVFTLISLKTIFYFPVLLLSINIFGKNGWKDLFGLLFGMICPILIVGSTLTLSDKLYTFIQYYNSITLFDFNFIQNWEILVVSSISLFVFISLSNITSQSIFGRKLFSLLLTYFVFSVLFSVLVDYNHTKSFFPLLFFGSIYSTSFFHFFRDQKTKTILLLIGVLISIALNIFVN